MMKKEGSKRGKGFVGKNAFSGKAGRRVARRAACRVGKCAPCNVYQLVKIAFPAHIQHPNGDKPFIPEVCCILDSSSGAVEGAVLGSAGKANAIGESALKRFANKPSIRAGISAKILHIDAGEPISSETLSLLSKVGVEVCRGTNIGSSRERGYLERVRSVVQSAASEIWKRMPDREDNDSFYEIAGKELFVPPFCTAKGLVYQKVKAYNKRLAGECFSKAMMSLVKGDKPSFRPGIRIKTTSVVGPKGEKMLRVDKISCLRYDQLPKAYIASGLHIFSKDKCTALYSMHEKVGGRVLGGIIVLEVGDVISPNNFNAILKICEKAGERLAAINLRRKEQDAYEQELLDWVGTENEVVI